MTGLCVDCCWLDMESQKRWAKAVKRAEADPPEVITDTNELCPEFNARYAYCTEPRNRRQPMIDAVAGTHLDGAPWLTCREVRRLYPECPDWQERKEPDAD